MVTWTFGATFNFYYNPELTTYDHIFSIAYPLEGDSNSNQTTLEQQIIDYDNGINSIDQSDWEKYSVDLIIFDNWAYFYANTLHDLGTFTLCSFDNLLAGTQYTVVAYADNYSGYEVAMATDHKYTNENILT